MQLLNDNDPQRATSRPAISTPVDTESSGPQFNIRDILCRCLANWYWFLICMAVTGSIAQYYLMSTNNVYTRSASILVKDSKSSINEAAEFADLSVFNNNTNIENELVILRSPMLMRDVVERLGLNNVYTYKDGLRSVSLYKNSPVEVKKVDSISSEAFSFEVNIKSPTQVELSDFRINGEDIDAGKKIAAVDSQIVATPVGRFQVCMTPFAPKYEGKSLVFSHTSPDVMAGIYSGRLIASKDKGQGSIIVLAISDESIGRADDILGALIDVYNERWIQDRNQISLSTSRFIDERLAIIEDELGHVESDISDFKSQNLIPDVGAVSSLYLSQTETTRQAVVDLTNQKALAQYIRKELISRPELTVPLPQSEALSNAQVSGLISEFNIAVVERNRLIAASSTENPLVKDMTQSLEFLRRNIMESVDNYISTLNAQISSYEKQAREATGKLAANPNQAKYLLSVERQQKVKESLYLYLLQKREENELSQAFTAYNTRLINPPGGSGAPTSPSRGMILMVSLLIGFLIPAVVITVSEMLNTRVRGRRDIEKMTVPFVGEIPLAIDPAKKGNKRRALDNDSSPYVIRKGGTDVINEAIRVVRSNMEFMFPEHSDSERGSVVAVTSINPGSGKSFISANLAAAFALKHKRVIIIDLDLRRATLSKRLTSTQTGVSTLLSGRDNNWRDLVISGTDGRPDFFPAGPIPPNPSELLYSDRLKCLLEELRDNYDVIFIDCPPVEVVADTYIINRYADLTLFVVRAGLLDRGMIPEIERLFTSGKLRNMGLILNGTESYNGSRRYGYSYSYGYGYSYNYK